MSKVMLIVSYEVRQEMRTTYLDLINQLRRHLQAASGKDYSVFEVRGRKNMFSEVYVSQNQEEFDALEDNQDETTQKLLQGVEACLKKGSTRYSTLIELDQAR
jgi:L-rhamnose mutarotase